MIFGKRPTLFNFIPTAGSIGFGAVFGNHWFHGLWPKTWHGFNIAVLELFPIVLAVHIWGACMADKCVTFFSDNAAVVDIINKQTSKDKAIMVLLRDFVLSCLKCHCQRKPDGFKKSQRKGVSQITSY